MGPSSADFFDALNVDRAVVGLLPIMPDPTVFSKASKYIPDLPDAPINPEFEEKINRSEDTGQFEEKPGAYIEPVEEEVRAEVEPVPEADALDVPAGPWTTGQEKNCNGCC